MSDLGSSFPTTLIEASSIAIWNNNKLVMGIAIIVWVTNVSVIILGKFLPIPSPTDVPDTHTNLIFYQVSCG
jgi:hypothetical protein